MRRLLLISLALALSLQALGLVKGSVTPIDPGVRTRVSCPDAVPAGRVVPLVADLDRVQPRDSASGPALLSAADAIVAGSIPRVTYRGGAGGDPVRYLYDEGVALRRVTGVLGYAYAATHQPVYLDALADVLLDATRWPDWNEGHPLDTAQVATAVAVAYSWTRDRLSPQQRTAVTDTLVSRLLQPYACGGGPLAARRTGSGNQASVVGTAVVLAGLAVRGDEPLWSATAVAQGTAALSRPVDGSGRSLADGPTAEGLMYTNYEASNLALLHATLRTNASEPVTAAALGDVLPSLDALAGWNERCGRVAEPDAEDGWDLYPWVDRATGLAAMAASPAAGPHLLGLVEALQQANRLTVPGHGSWPVPDGIAELVLSSLTPGGAPTPPVQAYVGGGPAETRYYGCATNATMYALLTGVPNAAPHSHTDVGNVVVTSGEQTVLADLGQRDYGFAGGPVWRAATRAHSTVGVVGSRGVVSQRADGSGSVSVEGADLLMTSSTALGGVPGWSRRVSLTDTSVRITDSLTSVAPTAMSVSYLLAAPPTAVTRSGDGSLVFWLDDGSTWQLVPPAGLQMSVTDAAPVPPYVDAPSIDALALAHTLVTLTATVDGTAALATEVRRIG